MPFPSDEVLMETARGLVTQLQSIFGKHPGFRPAHAKGVLLRGTFIPTPVASRFSSAPHFAAAPTPITIRFSNSTGLPNIPDTDPNADPRGIAIRFHLPEDPTRPGRRVHTDIVAHSTPFFPTRTGTEFLEFLQALAASGSSSESPSPVEKFLATHPSALAFVQAPKPAPTSYAKDTYYSVTAFKFIAADGKETFIRYRVVPELGNEFVAATDLSSKGAEYLQDEIVARLAGPEATFSLRLVAQVAEQGDVTDNSTVHWPEDRKLVELGVINVEEVVPRELAAKEQKYIIFDPIPRVEGIEPSDDPLLEIRAAVYLLSGRERRAAP